MKQKKRKYDDPNCIEETARELFGYDDASLNAEMNEAERAWAAEKAANPEAAAKAQRDADEGFDKLMANIRKKGIQPVSEAEYEEEEKKNNLEHRQSIRPRKRKKKFILLVAAVLVMGFGTTMVVVAHREYKYSSYPLEAKRNRFVKQNAVLKEESGRLEEAYNDISENLNIKVVTLAHIPEGMKFEKMVIDENCAIIEFLYEGKSVYLREKQYAQSKEVAEIITSDRKACTEVYNAWLEKVILVEENKLETGLIEYSATIDQDESLYYLSGVMQKEEFIKMVEGVRYQH